MDASDYEYLKGESIDLWAWQFLRRNDEYRSQWKNKSKSLYEKNLAKTDFGKFLTDEMMAETPDPGAQKWGLSCGYENPDRQIPIVGFSPRIFGRMIPDLIGIEEESKQITDRYKQLGEKDEFIKKLLSDVIFRQNKAEIPEGSAAVVFDLSLPIKPQVKHAKQLLMKVQQQEIAAGRVNRQNPSIPKSLFDLYTRYLRILDAKEENNSSAQIAGVIFPTEINDYPNFTPRHKIEQNYKAAKDLVNKGYLKLFKKHWM